MKRCRETLHHYYIITFIGVFWVMSPVILLSSIYMLTLYNPSSMCPSVCPSLLSHPWCPAAELSVAVQYITLSHTRFTVISISPFQQFHEKVSMISFWVIKVFFHLRLLYCYDNGVWKYRTLQRGWRPPGKKTFFIFFLTFECHFGPGFIQNDT